MTLIIAHRDGWMVADRMTSFGADRAPIVVDKVINLGYALLSACGDSGFRQHAAKALKGKTERTIVGAVAKFIRGEKPDNDVLIVTKSHRLCWVDRLGCVYDLKPEQSWWSLGSSKDTANGWLACWQKGTGALVKRMPIQVATEALEYAMTVDAQVGHGFQVERLR